MARASQKPCALGKRSVISYGSCSSYCWSCCRHAPGMESINKKAARPCFGNRNLRSCSQECMHSSFSEVRMERAQVYVANAYVGACSLLCHSHAVCQTPCTHSWLNLSYALHKQSSCFCCFCCAATAKAPAVLFQLSCAVVLTT